MAYDPKMEVVAEDVETAEQCVLLLSPSRDEVQGYFLGKPMLVQKIQEYMVAAGGCLPVISRMTGAKSEISIQTLEKA